MIRTAVHLPSPSPFARRSAAVAAPALADDRAVAETVAAVWQPQDADDHSAEAPVLASGTDARVVGAVLDRLAEHGRTRVWQVVAR